jgi:hypothetical protein
MVRGGRDPPAVQHRIRLVQHAYVVVGFGPLHATKITPASSPEQHAS